jgi:hypothetical protein
MYKLDLEPARFAARRPCAGNLRRRIQSVPGHGPAPLLVKTLDTQLTQTSLAPLHIATMILGASATIALLLGVLVHRAQTQTAPGSC